MSELDDLHARVLADPDDDACRLVYADALSEVGDARGEFITAQCALAAAGIHDVDDLVACTHPDGEVIRLGGLLRRVNQLLHHHGAAWQREVYEHVQYIEYRRGLPDSLSVKGEHVGSPLSRALARTTVRSVTILSATPHALAALAHEPPRQLRRLDLFLADLDDLAPLERLLAELPALETFEIRSQRGSRAVPPSIFALLPHLRSLQLDGASLGPNAIDELGRLPSASQLRRLDLGNNTALGDTALAALDGRFPALDELRLFLCNISAQGLEQPDLAIPRVLELDANGIGDAGLAALLAHDTRALEVLGLDSCEIGNAGLRTLAASPHLGALRRLALGQGTFTDAGLRALADSASARLTHLAMEQVAVTPKTLRTLFASPRHALASFELWPEDDRIDHAALADALADEPRARSLRNLQLHGCRLDDRDITRLATSPHLASLRALRVTDNRINNDGALALAHSRQPLVSLALYGNHIRARGQRAWIEAPLPALVWIDTRGIGDPTLLQALRERYGKGFFDARTSEDGAKPGLQILFPGTPRVTPKMIRALIAAHPGLVDEGQYSAIRVRDTAAAETCPIEISISHARTNRSLAQRRVRRPYEGLITLAYLPGDAQDLAATLATLAGELAQLTGGVVYDLDAERVVRQPKKRPAKPKPKPATKKAVKTRSRSRA